MEIQLVPVLKENRDILYRLYQLYQHDFSLYTDFDVNDRGEFSVSIEHYWQDPRWNPFIIYHTGQMIGFLVVLFENYDVDPDPTHVIYDFMVLRKYRRKGLGKQAAMKAFDLYSAKWATAQMEDNEPAISFWRQVIEEYTSGNYHENYRADRGKYIQTFSNKKE
ncbi:GNAT family N-acetyltransferase [Paenibacillus selenitireducens]|uniref:GNAT family N-acetyltransferase n=1 Tax=Paenibacillus selenitireducens TaxID=1324314 RepID=A0A1T2X5Z5_9BACL|nr:GNAT family N-acetyltransferase [Paenibacillus selenitireducens]OPA75225.1 GNAT family N-acetyltransferase [Paenibacillus selenitireducens]